MKKVLGIMFTLLLAVTLVACKKDDKKPPVGLTDEDYVAAAKTALSLGSEEQLKNVIHDVDLPLSVGSDEEKVTISWNVTLGDAIVIEGSKGKITRPETNAGDASVTLKATLTKGEATDTKSFDLIIKELVDAVIFTSFKQVTEYVIENDIDYGKNDADGYMFELETATVIGHSRDGYYVSSGNDSMYVHSSKKPDVGTTGRFSGSLLDYFRGFQLGASSGFIGETTVKTIEEVKALAKTTKTVKNFTDRAPQEQEITENSDFEKAIKRDMDLMGFAKMEAYIKYDPTIGYAHNMLVLYDNVEDIGTNKLVQVYYKTDAYDSLKTLGEAANGKKITIYYAPQELRGMSKDAAPGGKAMNVFRLTVLHYEVDLANQEKANVVEGNIKADLAKRPHYVKVEDNINVLNFTDTEHNGIISWKFQSETDENNKLIDLETKKIVSVPTTEQEVKLTYTVKVGDATVTGNLSLIVGLPTVIKDGFYNAINAAESRTFVSFETKVIKDGSKFFIVDGDKNIQVFVYFDSIEEEALDAAVEGELTVIITAQVDASRNPRQLNNVFKIEVK